MEERYKATKKGPQLVAKSIDRSKSARNSGHFHPKVTTNRLYPQLTKHTGGGLEGRVSPTIVSSSQFMIILKNDENLVFSLKCLI